MLAGDEKFRQDVGTGKDDRVAFRERQPRQTGSPTHSEYPVAVQERA